MADIVGLLYLDRRPIDGGALQELAARAGLHWATQRRASGGLSPRFLAIGASDPRALRLCDAEAGRARPGGGLILAAKLRVDNRSELYADLGVSAQVGAALTEIELVCLSYQRWGMRFGRHLIGQYAVILWDAREGRLVCVHDAMADAGLYFHQTGERLVVSSSSRLLRAFPGVSNALNLKRVAEFPAFRSDPSETFFGQIRRVPPGHQLVAAGRRVRLERYWSPLDHPRIRLKSDREYAERFTEVFDAAVACHLGTDQRIGLLLSGGLDSSAIAASAAGQLAAAGRRLTSFTSVPPDDFDAVAPKGVYYDETALVAEVCRCFPSIDANFIADSGAGLSFLDDRLVPGDFAPVVNPDAMGWVRAICESAMAQGVRLMLTGQTGNLTISHSGGNVLSWLAATGGWGRLAAEIGLISARSGHGHWPLFKAWVVRPMVQQATAAARQRWRSAAGSRVNPSSLSLVNDRLARRVLAGRSVPPLPDLGVFSRRSRAAYLLSGEMLDQADAVRDWLPSFGLEWRDPTRDRRVVEFCLAIPEDQFYRDGQGRSLVRRAMVGRLPMRVTANQRRGLQRPDWFRLLDRARPEIVGLTQRLEASDLAASCLDLARIRELVDHWPVGDAWQRPEVRVRYRSLLQRGLSMGRFLLLHEEASRPSDMPQLSDISL